jgi:LysM repeat protein
VSASPDTPTDLGKRKDDRTLAEKLADASVETKVTRALRRASSLRVFPFRPTVIDGHLILRGDVNTPAQYHRAERIAGQVEGVTALTNRLTMGGRPVTEERLAAATDDSEGTAGGNTAVYHTVRQGDTLWDIARKYRASIDQIRSLNDLRSSNLRPGQRIRVR